MPIQSHTDSTIGRYVKQYAREGHWKSTYAAGIRGRVGAQHRTVSTYINELLGAGFKLAHLVEPTLPAGVYDSIFQQMTTEIPAVMLIEAVRHS
jgi:hypothetical protein